MFYNIIFFNTFFPMQQISEPNARSGARPIIWITLLLHLALGGYLYIRSTAAPTAQNLSAESNPMEQTAKP